MEFWHFNRMEKYDKEKNPLNMVVGSNTNAYINLGFLLNWQISSNTNLRGGVGVTHYSNGNTSYPNSGVNTIRASVGVTRIFGTMKKAHILLVNCKTTCLIIY